MRAAGAGAGTSAAAAVGPAAAAPASPGPAPAAPPPPLASQQQQQQPGLHDGDARQGAGADADDRAHAPAPAVAQQQAGRLAHGFLPCPLPHAFLALRSCCSWLARGGSLMLPLLLLRFLPLLLLLRGEGGAALRGKAPAMAPASASELSSVRGNFVALLLLVALDRASSAARLLVRCFLEEAAGGGIVAAAGAVFHWLEYAEERGLSLGLDVRARGLAADRVGYRTAGTAGPAEVNKQFVAIAAAGGGAVSVRHVRVQEACCTELKADESLRVHACCGAAVGMELVDWSKSQRGGAAITTAVVVLLYY